MGGKLAGRKFGFLWLSGGGISALFLQATSEDSTAARPRSAGAAPGARSAELCGTRLLLPWAAPLLQLFVGIFSPTQPLHGAGLRAGALGGEGKRGDGRQPPHTSGAGTRPGSGHGHRAGHAPGRGHLSARDKNTSCCLGYFFFF